MSDRLEAFAVGFRKQAEFCHLLGSPFSAALLEQAADAFEAGDDIVATYMPWWEGSMAADVATDVLPLRFLGCAHALALSGDVPVLARHYPSCGGDGVADGVWKHVLEAFAAHTAFTTDYVTQPPQTNEVARSGSLVPGLLELARLVQMPLATFELGASAGLLQGLDRFHYTFGSATWGNDTSDCRMTPDWTLPLTPPVGAPLTIAARRACDATPIDILNPDNALKVRSYIWTDMPERLARLDAAIAIAQEVKPVVEKASADVWLEDVLGGPGVPGQARCVLHSVMWQYMPKAVQNRAYAAIVKAGEAAKPEAPVAWLRLEPETNNKPMHVALALWRGDGTCDARILADSHPHGTHISWLGWDNGRRLDSPELVQNFN